MSAHGVTAHPSNRPEARRVRHETRLRHLTVQHVQHLTPKMYRIALGGSDLAGFTSLGFDDHVKVFFPQQGQPEPVLRDYTPRKYDAADGILYLDFVIHDAGPATTWAANARPGTPLGVGGPRGSFIIPTQFDWHLLIGDETALPAIGRRLEELPADTRALVVAEIENPEEEQTLTSAAPFDVIWVHRNAGKSAAGDTTQLLERLRSVTFPQGEYFAWVAGETQVARTLRQYLLTERAANKQWLKAAGYWRRGAAGAHERIDD
jgi:NADPH-dependent ferric siderophore reductase